MSNVTLAKAARIVIFALFGSAAFAQAQGDPNADRVLRFAHTEVPQSLNEIATAIRSIAEIRQVSVAAEERVLALRGTPGQMAMAEWLFAKLDQTPGPRPATKVNEYTVPGTADDVVRVFYLVYPETVQAFQEIATAIRSAVEIRRAFTYNALKAFVVRGSVEQMAMAEWLVNRLDKPAGRSISPSAVYPTPANADDILQVFYLTYIPNVSEFQEVATLVRSMAELRRVFTNNSTKAIVVRGTPGQLALAAWLVNEMDQPAGRSAVQVATAREYRVPNSGDDLVRVFFLPQIATVQGFQEVAQLIRSQASIRRVFTYNAPRALVLRGTMDQMAQAERLTTELVKKP